MRLRNWFATLIVALSTLVWVNTAQATAPTISNLSITTGAVGASVTITGTNFGTSQGTSTVKFNGTTATANWGASSILVTVPTGATTGNVVVTVSNKSSNGISFTVVPAPSISTLSISSGAVGAAVTITGTSFGTSQGTGTVTFNGTTASVTSWNATTIGVTVPSGATTGNVVVNASGVASNPQSFTVAPRITNLSSSSGIVGSAVTITGTTFGTTGTVTFNGTTASATSWTSTSIAVTVPSGATTGNVVVTVGGVASNATSFTVTPNITNLSIATGAVGAPVTITGTTFGTTGTVTFNGTAATYTSWTSTSIAVTVPSGATTGNVVVTVGGVASNGYSFTVVQTPNISTLSINTGAVGAAVTITGTGFGTSQGTGTVTFNGTAASVTSWASTSIAVTVPSGATNGNVVVNTAGVASNGMGFTVAPAPNIASLSLTSGPVGSPITITGTNFGSTQGTVSFNGIGATPTSWSATSIGVTVPSGATTGNVVVNASGVSSNGINFIVSTLPPGWLDQDIGSVGTAGTANYSNGVFTMQGSGGGFLGGTTADAFHFAYQSLTGDGTIVARMASKAGGEAAVMLRETLGTSATTMSSGSWSGNQLFYRTTSGSAMVGVNASGSIPYWFKVTRSGNTFTGYVAADGVNWVKVGASQTINMAQTIYVGLGVSSGNGIVTFDGVSVTSSANPGPVITSVSATTGSIGSQVIINGQNFGGSQGNSSVLLNGAVTTINSWSATSITITIPIGASSGSLVVSVAPGMNDSNPVSFTITSNPLPAGWLDQDIGPVGTAGTATYSNGVFTVRGSGVGFLGGTTADAFHYAYQTLTGDGSVVARMTSLSGGEAAVMMRETLDPGATTMSSGNWASDQLFYRTTTGSAMASVGAAGNVPYWFKVTRSGNTFTGYVAADGVNWVKVGASQTINMAQTIYVGLGVASGNTSVTFDGVSLNSSANPGPVITTVSATTGSVGSQVVISGQNFGTTQGNSSVLLNGAVTTINSWSATSITITIPTGASSGSLLVSVAPGMDESNAIDFTITTNPLPSGWLDQDVGAVGATGSATYSNGVFTVKGSGSGLLGSETADSFHFVYQALTGDGTILARIASINGGQAGVMVRETLDASATTMATSNFAGSDNLVYRTTTGGSTVLVSASGSIPYWFRVTRTGGVFTGYTSTDGMTWETVSLSQSINMAQTIYIGFGVSSTQPGQLSTATFDNVSQNSVANPAPFISSISPTDGPIGTQVVISGANFGAAQGNSRVTLNSMATTINSWSATSITITIPTGASSGNLVVTVAPGMNNSNPVEFTITSNPLPPGWLDQDVGYVGQAGSSTYTNGVFSITAGGNGTSGDNTQDGYHFDYRVLSGDGTIIARVANGNSGWPGVMMRETLSSGAKSIYLRGSNGALLESRNITGGAISQVTGAAWSWVKLVRTGTDFVGYISPDGVNWTVVGGTVPISMADSIYVGLAMTSDNLGHSYTATFDNVSVSGSTNPAPVISSLSATTGPVGTQIIVNGSGFGTSQGTSTVTLNNLPVTIGLWSDTSIAVTIPTGATSGNLIVLRAPTMDTSNPVVFTVTTLPIPSGWFDQDIGLVCVTGSATYSGGVFTINGADHCVGSADALHFVYQPIASDFTIVARVTSLSSFARAGVMVRQTLDPNSPAASTVTSPAGTPPYSVEFDYRNLFGIPPTSTWAAGAMPGWVKLTRAANAFTGFFSADGINWTQLGTTQTIPINRTVYVGLASNAFGGTALATSTIDSVSLTLGAAEPNPVISGVLPTSGGPGSVITISGSGFGATQGASTANFNGVAATTISSWSDTQIQAAVPDSATTGPVSVVVGNILGNGPNFTVAFPATITDSLGNQTTYNSGLFGGQWSFTNAQGSGCSSCTVRGTTQNQYDNKGHLLWTIDPLGHGVVYQSDASGNMISQQIQGDTTTPTATTNYTYNTLGQPVTVTDPLGNVTTNVYDTHGNLTSVTTPKPNTGTAASVTQFGYNTLGQLTTITDPLQNISTLTYTPVGLIATITDMQQNVTTYGYDSHGNRTSVMDALHHQTTFAYDAGDRLTLITYPDSTTTGFGYDYRGRRTSVTDQNGKITTYAYDDADRLISVTDAAIPPNVTNYAYDTENNLTSITDANQNQTVFVYDAFGRVKQTNFPSSQIETYAYDANNNLISKTDRKSQTIQYVYDVLNRLTRKIYPDSTEADYVYDLVGKIQQVNDPTGTYAFAYDNMGRLIGTTTNYSFLAGKTFANGYSYDAASNRTGFTDPETGSTTYAYDTLNRLQTLTPPSAISAGSFGFSYDALSRRTQLTRPNSVTTNYGYDNLSHLLSVLHQVSASTIDGASYTVDSAGNRTAKTDHRLALTTNYGYDSIYQLLSATQSGSATENYTYDPVGNRLSSLGVASYTNNTSNELTATSNASYSYDLNGNAATKNDSTGITTYAWDFENRMTSVTLPGNGGTVSFKYDPFGRRIYKSSSSGTSVFTYDGDNLIEETNAAGAVVARYSQGLNIDEPLAMLRSSATSFYNADGLGSITSLANAAGALAQTYTFDSFGKQTASTGSLTNPFQYTGRESDSETGLYYYRARYYDAAVGRFLSEDPIRSPIRPNLYKYVRNSTPNRIDSSGKTDHPYPRGMWGRYRGCTLVGTLALTLWTDQSRFGSPSDWRFVSSVQIGPEGGEPGVAAAAISCIWERTYTAELWGHVLTTYTYHCWSSNCFGYHQWTDHEFQWSVKDLGKTSRTERNVVTLLGAGADDENNDILCVSDPDARP